MPQERRIALFAGQSNKFDGDGPTLGVRHLGTRKCACKSLDSELANARCCVSQTSVGLAKASAARGKDAQMLGDTLGYRKE